MPINPTIEALIAANLADNTSGDITPEKIREVATALGEEIGDVESGATGPQGPAGTDGAAGTNGWSPIFAVVSDGARRVLQVTDWTGGSGTEPASPRYIGASGFTTVLADAIDIRGAEGTGGGGSAAWGDITGTITDQTDLGTYVAGLIAAVVDSAPGALDTLNELAAALGDDANFAATVTNALALKAPLASPTFTGTPAAPTAAVDTNTTQVATTAHVRAQINAQAPAVPLTGFTEGAAIDDTFDPDAAGNRVAATDTILQAFAKVWMMLKYLLWRIGFFPNYYNVEFYGAVPITDFSDPDSTPDSTAAIMDCFQAYFAAGCPGKVLVPGRYHCSSDPSKLIGGVQHYCQLWIPHTPYNAETFPVFAFQAGNRVSNQTQLITPMAQSLSGSGFYSSWVDASANEPFVLGYEQSYTTPGAEPYAAIFATRNYTNVDLGDISVIVKTMDGTGAPITNKMNGIDLEMLTHVTGGNVRVAGSCPIYSSSDRNSSDSIGIRTPGVNNHAETKFDKLVVSGFKTGAIIGEHTCIGQLVTAGNRTGFDATNLGYPATILHYTSEGNKYNIAINNAALFIGTWSGENMNSGEWYANTNDVFVGGTATDAHLVVAQHTVHFAGGASATITSNVAFDLKVISDENGVCQIPMNHWTTGNEPTGVANYVWGLDTTTGTLRYHLSGSWYDVGTGGGVTYILFDDFDRANNTSSIGNLVTPASAWSVRSGTWGIDTNEGYEVTETNSGGVVVHDVVKDAGVADFTLELDVTLGASAGAMIPIRSQDASNGLGLEIGAAGVNFNDLTSGTYTPIDTEATASNVGTNTYKVICSGTSISVYRNGAILYGGPLTVAAYATETLVGLGVINGTGFGGGVRFNDFKVY